MKTTQRIWQDASGTWRFLVNKIDSEGYAIPLEVGTASSKGECEEIVQHVLDNASIDQ